MKLYWGSGSPFAWRAMLSLLLKGAQFEDQQLQFSKRENKSPEYLELNPRGKVPTLVDGDNVIVESLAIMAYVDARVDGPALFGEGAQERALIMRLISEHEHYLGPAANTVLVPMFRGTVTESADEIAEGARKLHDELALVEARLGVHPWLAGERVTAADAVLYPTLELVNRFAGKPEARALDLDLAPEAPRYPNLGAWRKRLAALPNVDRAYPPHWRE